MFRVDDVQGKEFRALFLSTVRTCYGRDDDDLEEDAGFLTNPKVRERQAVTLTHSQYIPSALQYSGDTC